MMDRYKELNLRTLPKLIQMFKIATDFDEVDWFNKVIFKNTSESIKTII